MLPGAWATATLTALAAAFYGMACVAALRRARPHGAGRSAVPALFAVIMFYLALAALRQGAAALSDDDPYFRKVDLALFYVLLVPAASAILPLVYLVANIMSQRRSVAGGTTFAFVVPVAVGLHFAYRDGFTLIRSDYGTAWHIDSPVTPILLLLFILLPALLGSAWLIHLARGLGDEDSRRLRLVGGSSLVYFAVFTLDALGLADLWLLMARIATAAAAVVAWRAYAHSSASREGEPELTD